MAVGESRRSSFEACSSVWLPLILRFEFRTDPYGHNGMDTVDKLTVLLKGDVGLTFCTEDDTRLESTIRAEPYGGEDERGLLTLEDAVTNAIPDDHDFFQLNEVSDTTHLFSTPTTNPHLPANCIIVISETLAPTSWNFPS